MKVPFSNRNEFDAQKQNGYLDELPIIEEPAEPQPEPQTLDPAQAEVYADPYGQMPQQVVQQPLDPVQAGAYVDPYGQAAQAPEEPAQQAVQRSTKPQPGSREAEDADGEDEEELHIPTVAEEIRTLALKIIFVLVAFFVVFTFIFGLHRNLSVDMQPSLRDGDLLFYYRLDKDYRANNVVVFDYKDEMIASRVIAVPGDTVDITEDGLMINGHVMIEPEIYSPTTQFKGGPTFPLTVEEGTVFVLGDNREHANDSRIIGLIDDDDVKGKVMGVIRRRNL